MKLFTRRRDTDALLNGEALDGDSGLGDVEAFIADMRMEFGALPAPEPRPTLASTLDGRRELRPASGPTPNPTFPAARPKSHALRPVAVVFATGAVLFGGFASAGALPGPLQRAAASIGSHVGIHLPGAPSPSVPKVRLGPATTTEKGDPGSQTTISHPATSPTTDPGTSATTATPASSVLPTTPTASTPPTAPRLEAPKLPISSSPLQGVIDPARSEVLPTVPSP